MARQAVATYAGAAMGGGAYGRGAYGRGSYGMVQGSGVKVNSLFKEYDRRRHETFSAGDETGRTTISRREYVMRVTAPTSTSFENTSFSINPGLSGVFAWLSQIASNYDEYELKHLVFHYKPVISQASQTGTMGSILMSANYNAGATKFASFREMAEYSGSLETRICDEALFGVECDPSKHSSQPIEFIRSGAVPPGQDVKTYDLGTFQLATSDVDAQSFPAGTLLGHMYVEYQVTLGKPKLFTSLGKGILQDMFRTTDIVTVGSPMLGHIANPSNTLGATITDELITLPNNFYGTIVVSYYIEDNTAGMVPFTTSGEITNVSVMGPDGAQPNEYCSGQNSGVFGGMIRQYFKVQPAVGNADNVIAINILATSQANRGATVTITQTNPDFISW
jgi:hypothetical protein